MINPFYLIDVRQQPTSPGPERIVTMRAGRAIKKLPEVCRAANFQELSGQAFAIHFARCLAELARGAPRRHPPSPVQARERSYAITSWPAPSWQALPSSRLPST
ncbi:hypothetical protein, partial [Mesorhizobium sp.]